MTEKKVEKGLWLILALIGGFGFLFFILDQNPNGKHYQSMDN